MARKWIRKINSSGLRGCGRGLKQTGARGATGC